MLTIQHAFKTYKGGKKALDDLSLQIAPGELFGFIGHNGAGKTTAIRMICGVLDFEQGEILIDGLSIRQSPVECKRKLAYIPDSPDLYENLTGIQYLNYIADIFALCAEERDGKIREYAEAFELYSALGDLISSYSHGMKQKLILISALIHSPKLLVLDEPFVGLDPQSSHRLKTIMRQICDGGGAIFFSTHVLDVAEKICDRIGILKNGTLVACGKTDELVGDKSLEEVFLSIRDAAEPEAPDKI